MRPARLTVLLKAAKDAPGNAGRWLARAAVSVATAVRTLLGKIGSIGARLVKGILSWARVRLANAILLGAAVITIATGLVQLASNGTFPFHTNPTTPAPTG